MIDSYCAESDEGTARRRFIQCGLIIKVRHWDSRSSREREAFVQSPSSLLNLPRAYMYN